MQRLCGPFATSWRATADTPERLGDPFVPPQVCGVTGQAVANRVRRCQYAGMKGDRFERVLIAVAIAAVGLQAVAVAAWAWEALR